MVITSRQILHLTNYRTGSDGNAKRELIQIRPGVNNYPNVNQKDPRVAEQLRIMRKHNRISFAELLDSDVAILDAANGTPEEKAAALVDATMVKKIVSVPVPKPKDAGTDSARRRASKGTPTLTPTSIAPGGPNGSDERPSEDTGISAGAEPRFGANQGGREVSRKGKNESR